MKKRIKSLFLFVLLAVMCTSLAMPVSAAKPQKAQLGIVTIGTTTDDVQYYLAVGVNENGKRYIYAGNHAIGQQIPFYVSMLENVEVNNSYEIREDMTYDSSEGIYRFVCGNVVLTGSEADVFPQLAKVKKNDVVYYVTLVKGVSYDFQIEKTTVASIKNGVITTKDKLESSVDSGEFAVIFDDYNNVVGFCKSGTAVTAVESGSSFPWGLAAIIAICVVVVIAIVVVVIVLAKKKKTAAVAAAPAPVQGGMTMYPNQDMYSGWNMNPAMDSDATCIDSNTMPVDYNTPAGMHENMQTVLICHGGCMDGRIYPVSRTGLSIGRGSDNGINYPDNTPGISRHHVKLVWNNGQLVLMDVGSSNGTYLNQQGRLTPMTPYILNNGDRFYLGEKRNCFEVAFR